MDTSSLLDVFDREMRCEYKGRVYLVRDNGAIYRLRRAGFNKSKLDEVWTFGKPNDKTGYMEIAGQRVHRIVAFAFHGNPPTEKHVVDHIDTNRQNNRPENLRWVTRLENILNNPITRARIENICGSVEAFLADPSVLRGYEEIDSNFSWMRAVSPEEARSSLKRMTSWAKERPRPKGGSLGEWVFQDRRVDFDSPLSNVEPIFPKPMEYNVEEKEDREPLKTQSLTPNAIQMNWRTPSEFPCCPKEIKNNPLEEYKSNLKRDSIFCKNNLYSSFVMDAAITDEGTSLWVMTRGDEESVKPWALAKIVYRDGCYIHESKGSFFDEEGAIKYFTLAQGKEWTGGDVFDDYC